ncbi:MAG: hypothetical protein AB1664_18360, partial [Thermodesulfobacteriota bacterium]
YTATSKGDLIPLHAIDALAASDAASGQWSAILAAMLQEQRSVDTRKNTSIVAFATVKNDKYLEAMEHVISTPFTPHDIEECAQKIQRWQKERTDLVRTLRPPQEEASSRKYVEISALIAAIRPHVEGMVSARTGGLLHGGQNAWEQAARQYGPMMGIIAKSLSPGFTTAALQRRRQIEGVAPNMRPRAAQANKARRQKGGQK